jgi:hypothetical protein
MHWSFPRGPSGHFRSMALAAFTSGASANKTISNNRRIVHLLCE